MTGALVALIVALAMTYVLLAWVLLNNARERERLINRLIATKASEVRVLDNEPRRERPRPEPANPVDTEFWSNFSGQVGG